MRLASSPKGVSEIIGALLVVCITVAAATLFAAYVSGLMGQLQTPTSQPYTEQLTLDYYNWVTLSSGPQITIRNDGAATITFADFFLQGVAVQPTAGGSGCPGASAPYSLTVQSSCILTFPVPTGLTVTSGIAYAVKLVAKDGTIFTFSCIAGSYTH
jgi:flagellin-like protein